MCLKAGILLCVAKPGKRKKGTTFFQTLNVCEQTNVNNWKRQTDAEKRELSKTPLFKWAKKKIVAEKRELSKNQKTSNEFNNPTNC